MATFKNFGLAKLFSSLVLLTAIGAQTPAFADAPGGLKFGLGVQLGDPSGLTARYWLNDVNSLDFGLAYSLDEYMVVTGHYVFNFKGVFETSQHLHPFAGIGALVGFGNDVAVGLQIPFGIEWMIGKSQFGLFLELIPTVLLVPNTASDILGVIGARFFFN